MRSKIPVVALNTQQNKTTDRNPTIIRRAIAIWLLLLGMALFCYTFSDASRMRMTLLVETFLLTAVFIVAGYWRKMQRIMVALDVVALFFLFLQNATGVIRGFIYMYNAMVYTWNERYGTYYSEISITELSQNDLTQACVILLLLMVLLFFYLTEYRNIIWMTILVYFMIGLNVVVGYADTSWCVIFLAAGWLISWNYMATPGHVGLRSFTSIVVVMTVGIVLASFLTVTLGRGSFMQNTKTRMADTIHQLRYGTDTLTEGALREDINFNSDTKNRLTLTMEKPEELHLRGFVGSVYNKTTWNQLDYTSYTDENSGLLDWLYDNGLAFNNQYGQYNLLAEAYKNQNLNPDSFLVSVKNVGADSTYLYTPASMSELVSGRNYANQDWQYKSKGISGCRNYSFYITGGDGNLEALETPNWMSTSAQEQVKTYLNAENIYQSFVYTQYLTIDEDTAALMNKTFYTDGIDAVEDMSIYELTSVIRSVLQGVVTYTETPDNRMAQDYISYVLESSKEGNSVAYATIATMAFRQAGIPARYVEGYCVTSSQAAQMSANETSEITLTSKDAHAWVEVYMDGIGWIPVEVTPGYYESIGTVDQYIQMQGNGDNGGATEVDLGDQTVTTYDNSGVSDNQDQTESEQIHVWNKDVLIGAIVLLLFIMSVVWVILELRRSQKKKQLYKQLRESTPNEAACILYVCIVNQLKFAKIAYDEKRLKENRVEFQEEFEKLSVWEFDTMVAIIQQAFFSGREISAHQLLYLESFYKILCQANREKLGILRRLVFRYQSYK